MITFGPLILVNQSRNDMLVCSPKLLHTITIIDIILDRPSNMPNECNSMHTRLPTNLPLSTSASPLAEIDNMPITTPTLALHFGFSVTSSCYLKCQTSALLMQFFQGTVIWYFFWSLVCNAMGPKLESSRSQTLTLSATQFLFACLDVSSCLVLEHV